MTPFYCGSQYSDWKESNCNRCKKGIENIDPDGVEMPTCEIELAILDAYMGDGEVTDEIAKRMDATPENMDEEVWMCGEVEWTDEWIKESERRQKRRVDKSRQSR